MGTLQRYYSSTSSLFRQYESPTGISFKLVTAINPNAQVTRSVDFRISEFSTSASRWRFNQQDTNRYQNTRRFESQSPSRLTDGTLKDQTEKRIERHSWREMSFEEGGKAISLRAAGWSDEKICTTLAAIAAAVFLSKLSVNTPSRDDPGNEEIHPRYGGEIKATAFGDKKNTFTSSRDSS